MQPAKLRFQMDGVRFRYPITVRALEMGGWLPLALSNGRTFILDRNVIARLRKLRANPGRPDLSGFAWWLGFLNRPDVRVNALLSGMEGDSRAFPSFDEFRANFEDARSVLVETLPHAQIIGFRPADYPAVYAIVDQHRQRHIRETQFIIDVAALVDIRAPARELFRRAETIIELADSKNLRNGSLSLLAALSCLFEREDGVHPRIGRGVLKPKARHTAHSAHNALSDLRALEFLASANALEGGAVALCTGDKALTALWCALGIKNPRLVHNALKVEFQPTDQLFPRLTRPEIDALVEHLRS